MCVACLKNASRGSDKKIYVIMFSKAEEKVEHNLIMIKKKVKRSEQTKMKSTTDKKEKLIQSHHLNIKTFPQTPLDCVIQVLLFYVYNEFGIQRMARHHRQLVSDENVTFLYISNEFFYGFYYHRSEVLLLL